MDLVNLVEANRVIRIPLSFYDQMYAVLLPVAIFLLYYVRRKDVYDLHHSILGNPINFAAIVSL